MQDKRFTVPEREEYLTLLQTAYLLGRSEQSTREIVKRGALQSVKWQNRIFIPVNSLESYVLEIIKKYEEAVRYLDLPDGQKAEYLKEILPETYHGYSPDPARFLTVIQAAYLMKTSRQAVYDLIRKEVFRRAKGFGVALIPIENFAMYITGKMNDIRPAINFLTKDPFSFWEQEYSSFERFYLQQKRRNQCQNLSKN